MFDTVTRYLEGISESKFRRALQFILTPLANSMSSQTLTNAGLVIHGAASKVAKTGSSALYALANGVLLTIAGSTDMPALVGTVVNATFNVFVFSVNSAGTVSSQMGIAGSTLAQVKFPQFPAGSAVLGFVIINPTGTGNFVGGTTALDDATVVPNAVYVSTVGDFDPSVLP